MIKGREREGRTVGMLFVYLFVGEEGWFSWGAEWDVDGINTINS